MLLSGISYNRLPLCGYRDAHVAAQHVGMDIRTRQVSGKARLRIGRHSEPGRIYLVTFCTFDRRPEFLDWDLATTVIRSMHVPPLWRSSCVLCWTLMPDHWHGLVELGAMDSLSALVGRIKGASARAANAARGATGRFWTDGFHDHALRDEEDLIAVARYIVHNPVRAGIVERVGLYPFWDAVWLGNEHRG